MQIKVHKMPKHIQPIPTSPYKWKEPSDKIFVVAGNISEFNNYKNKKISEGSKNHYYYVSSPENLRGLSEIKGVYIGTWTTRSDIREIEEQINVIKQKMAAADAASKAAGIIAQEIDAAVLHQAINTPKINATWTDTGGFTAMTMADAITQAPTISSAYPITGEEKWFKDLMKKYIDEALKNPSTRGGI